MLIPRTISQNFKSKVSLNHFSMKMNINLGETSKPLQINLADFFVIYIFFN